VLGAGTKVAACNRSPQGEVLSVACWAGLVGPARGQTPLTIDSKDHGIGGWTQDEQAWISAAVWNIMSHR
jgi:hypothetical protein